MHWLTMSDGHRIYVKSWGEDQPAPRAIIQLAHGMAEHINRYEHFAQSLASKGFIVYGNDHRGHGQTGIKSGKLGFFAEENGFERVVADLKEINDQIIEKHPTIPIFIMGHSMGSFIVRRYVQIYRTKASGIILSGTGGNPGVIGKIGKGIARAQMKKIGKQKESPFMNQLIFGQYHKAIPNHQTEFDWLTRDQQEVNKYIDDDLCGFIATSSFYYDLLEGIDIIHRKKEVMKIDKSLPFLFISGTEDPVGQATKGVLHAINQFKRHGIEKIQYIFYDEGRHEMLNEINREEVIEDIIHWIEKQL